MRTLLWILGPLAGASFLLACDGSEPHASLEIESVNACKSARCKEESPQKAKDPEDGSSANEPGPPKPEPTRSTPDAPENTCETALDLGEMAGERNAATANGEPLVTQGSCTTWAKVRVNETSNVDNAMVVRATLISPPGKKFDLFAYVNPEKDEVECQTPIMQSENKLSSVDELTATWGDSWAHDDSRTLTFEVRSRDGSCASNATWSLLVQSAI